MNLLLKSISKVSLIATIAFCFIETVSAQTNSLPAPVKITSVEGITEYQLANGLKILIFPDQSKATITVNITYLVGSRMEGYGETGMAHLLEHMVFKGSTHHENVPQELTAHGAQPNGTTWYDRTNYFETFAASEDNLRWALDLESDRMVNSFIAKEDLETEFSVVRNEFEMGENSPSSVLEERVMSTAYLWHNYGKSTIGSKEDIEKVPIENLQAFYKKYYQPDNAVLMITGKIDEAKTLALANEYFGKIPKPTRSLQEPYTMEPIQDGERLVELKRVGDVQVVSCGYHIPSGSHPDYAAVDVLVDVLTDAPSGRLYKALIETKKASDQYGYAFSMKDPGYAYFSADVLKEKSIDDAKQTMLGVLDDLKNNPVTAAEVDRSKTKLLKDIDLMFNNSSRLGLSLSEYIAQGDWRLLFIYRDNLEKVTADDVNRVANAYFKESNRTIGIFTPDAAPDRAVIPVPPDVSALVNGYVGRKTVEDAEAFDPSPSNIDSRTKSVTLNGGAKYSYLSKTTRGHSVNAAITLRIGSESSLENKSTLASFTASMLNKGTKNKTREQIADEFDRLHANVNFFSGGQTVSINIQTEKEYLADVLHLVTEILRDPSFPAGEFEKLKEERLSGIEESRSEPSAIASMLLQQKTNPYPKGHFRYSMSFDEQVAAIQQLKPEDLQKFYSDFYNSTNATVAIVGDFDEATTMEAINKMLSDWKSPIKYERSPESYFDVSPTFEKTNTPDKANAVMMAGYNVQMRDDNPDYAAMVMANYMLGGGFLNSRLAVRIRQNEGISYGVGSWFTAGVLDEVGSFGSQAIYNPDNSERLITAYKEELQKVITDGFTVAELKDAVTGYLQSRQVGRSQDAQLAPKLSSYLFLNRTMQWDAGLEQKISALTVEQVNAAVKKWLHPEKITFVQAGDFERSKSEEKN